MSTKTVFMEDNQNESAYDSGKVDVIISPTGEEDLYITGDLLAQEEELEYFVINI